VGAVMKPWPGFVGPSNVSASPVVDVERTVNWYPDMHDAGTPQAATWLRPTPGFQQWASDISVDATGIGVGPHRGAFFQNSRQFAISGIELYEIDRNGYATLRGSFPASPGIDQGTIVSNGTQLLIVVGGYGYVYTPATDVLAPIADLDFPQDGSAVSCCFFDGYGMVFTRNTTQFQISALNDFTSWDATDVAQKSQTTDYITAIYADIDRKLFWVCGEQNTELWWDSGAAGFPFEPVPNSILTVGATSAAAITEADGDIVWMGQSIDGGRRAYRGRGMSYDTISTAAIESIWDTYHVANDIVIWNMEWLGHPWAVFQFPEADATWVYDLSTKQWFEWLTWNPSAGAYASHPAITHVYAFGRHLVGSHRDGQVYHLQENLSADNGIMVRRLRRGPHLTSNGDWVLCQALQCQFQPGVTEGHYFRSPSFFPQVAEGIDPQVMMRLSRDGGLTWGTERWASMGKTGEYAKRVRFLRNGRFRDGVLELMLTDGSVTSLVQVWADLEAVA
jgi:hypothetical protein